MRYNALILSKLVLLTDSLKLAAAESSFGQAKNKAS